MKPGLRPFKPLAVYWGRHLCSRHMLCIVASKPKLSLRRQGRPLTIAYVKKLYEDGQLDYAIQAAEDMHHEGFAASTEVLYNLLQRCIDNKDLTSGRRVHQLIINCGFVKNAFLGSHLIRMFTLCGSLKEATHVFDNIPTPTVFTWQALIMAYALNGNAIHAIEVYKLMQMSNVVPDQHIFVSVLKACAKAEYLAEGKLIHAQIVVSILESNAYVDNTLIDMYVKCHSLEDAHFVFDRVLSKDVVTWTAIIEGYGEHGHNLEAMALFQQMQCEGMRPNSVTYVSVFKACSEVMMQTQGSLLHACISGSSEVACDTTLGNTLVAMYAKCRRLKDAVEMLKWMPKKDIVTWNVLIAANVQHGHGHEALLMYQNLQKEGFKPDDVTFIGILKACSSVSALEQGKLIHVDILDSGLESLLFVRNALIDMYGKCGCLEDAYAVFRSFPKNDIVTRNTLIAGYIQYTHNFEALAIFHQMQKDGIESDSVTYAYTLQACSSLASLLYGMLIHIYIILSGISIDFYLLSCLIDMYIKCGSFEDAHNVLKQSPQKSMTLANGLVASCVWHGQEEDSLNLSHEEAVAAYSATFVKLLKACALLNALDLGKQIHGGAIEVFHGLNLSIGNALIDMYAKCGSIKDAHGVLCRMSNRDAVTWTTLISGYGQYTDYQFASQCFEKMVKEGVTPVETTYVCLLTTCSRAGLVKEGCKYFESMVQDYGLLPTVDHYYCMVDLFGRSGRLMEAEDILQTIPLSRPTIVGPRTLLNHCKFHGNVELGQQWIGS